jgi:hypothetical protein
MRALYDGLSGVDWNKVWMVFSTIVEIINGGDTYHAPARRRLLHIDWSWVIAGRFPARHCSELIIQ